MEKWSTILKVGSEDEYGDVRVKISDKKCGQRKSIEY